MAIIETTAEAHRQPTIIIIAEARRQPTIMITGEAHPQAMMMKEGHPQVTKEVHHQAGNLTVRGPIDQTYRSCLVRIEPAGGALMRPNYLTGLF